MYYRFKINLPDSVGKKEHDHFDPFGHLVSSPFRLMLPLPSGIGRSAYASAGLNNVHQRPLGYACDVNSWPQRAWRRPRSSAVEGTAPLAPSTGTVSFHLTSKVFLQRKGGHNLSLGLSRQRRCVHRARSSHSCEDQEIQWVPPGTSSTLVPSLSDFNFNKKNQSPKRSAVGIRKTYESLVQIGLSFGWLFRFVRLYLKLLIRSFWSCILRQVPSASEKGCKLYN